MNVIQRINDIQIETMPQRDVVEMTWHSTKINMLHIQFGEYWSLLGL
jgi:hypothetical protein